MYRVLAVVLAIVMSGCGMSSGIIKSEALDFGGIIEDTTNKLLVMNVLRARDKAPLHFADIPIVRESIQQSASFSLLQFTGRRLPTQTTDALTAGGSIQFTPSFEINHLHSKDFITGISSPIDPKVVKYWLDRGLDRRIALLLFFSAVEIIETRSAGGAVRTIRIANSPREAAEAIKRRGQSFSGPEAMRCDMQSDFERYLKLFNALRTFFATTYRERRLLAANLKASDLHDGKNLQALAALDPNKVQLVHDPARGAYSLYSLSSEQKIAFCFFDDAQAAGKFESIDSGPMGTSRSSCAQPIVDVGMESALRAQSPSPIFFSGAAAVSEASPYCRVFNQFVGAGPTTTAGADGYPKLELRLYIRSVGEIFQFLGDLLHYQDEVRRYVDSNPQMNLKLNSPVTFGYCGDKHEAGCDDIFLRLDGDPCNARFSLNYREREYYIGNFDPPGTGTGTGDSCRPDATTRKDHTLEILVVLHQLVGLNKSATDIRSTPAVQLLP